MSDEVELDHAAVLRTFVTEVGELLSAMEAALLALDAEPGDAGKRAELLRLAHTVKGNASLLGFDDVVAHAHTLESALERAELPMARATVSELLGGVDLLRETMQRATGEERDSDGDDATIRVSLARLDRMLEMIGEVMVGRARMRARLDAGEVGRLRDEWDELERPLAEPERTVTRARTVPIGPSFRPYARLVRELAEAHGKRARLEVAGEEVEVDARVVDELRDPLTHLLRNALDHGLERAEERIAAGKDLVGRIRLTAHREGSHLELTLADDGAGIDRARLVRRAAERGFGDVAAWDDRRLHGLLFEPGFSTRDQVTELSGRGVGLDVVLRHVQALRGSVEVTTSAGRGSAFVLRVPLSVALLSCFAVEAGGDTFLLPSDAVRGCLELGDAGVRATLLVNVRGEPLPCVRLGELFGRAPTVVPRPSVVVVEHGQARAGLVVDRLLGEQQTMVKPLAGLFRRADVVSGSAVLGTGRVALVVDVASVIRRASETSRGER